MKVDLPYVGNLDNCIRRKESIRAWMLPVLIIRIKVEGCQVPRDTRHIDIAIAPWWTKIEVERIVLLIGSTSNIVLNEC